MTTNKNKKDFMGSEAKPMKWESLADCCQSSHNAEFQHADYRKETPRGEFGFINPKSRNGSGNTANLRELRVQSFSKNFKDRMTGYRHSKLNT